MLTSFQEPSAKSIASSSVSNSNTSPLFLASLKASIPFFSDHHEGSLPYFSFIPSVEGNKVGYATYLPSTSPEAINTVDSVPSLFIRAAERIVLAFVARVILSLSFSDVVTSVGVTALALTYSLKADASLSSEKNVSKSTSKGSEAFGG